MLDPTKHAVPTGAFQLGRRTLRFIVSGGLSAGLYFVLAYGLLRSGVEPLNAGFTAYAISFLTGYGLQRQWTFAGRHRHQEALPRYFALQACCAAASAVALELGHALLAASPLVVSLVTTVVLGALSYVVSSRWVFRSE
jgi:putative flippase GtrA